MSTRLNRWLAVAVMVVVGADWFSKFRVANLGDRLVNGGVTDFILFHPFPFVFNVADAAITVGAILLAGQMWISGDQVAPSSVQA